MLAGSPQPAFSVFMGSTPGFKIAIWLSVGIATLLVGMLSYLGRRVISHYDQQAEERDEAIESLRRGQRELQREVRAVKRRVTQGEVSAHDQVEELDEKVDQILDRLDDQA
jgi:membrane protein implicated in regulation of membrane protease activity